MGEKPRKPAIPKSVLPTSPARRRYLKRRERRARRRGAVRAGGRIERKWAEQFVKAGYKYVFVQVPVKGYRKSALGFFRRGKFTLSGRTPEVDILFGNDLNDLRWFDSKLKNTTSFSPAQRTVYPQLNKNGGLVVLEGGDLPINLVTGEPVNLDQVRLAPNGGHVAFDADHSAVASGQRNLPELMDQRRGNLHPPSSDLLLDDSRLITERRQRYKDPDARGTGGGTGGARGTTRPPVAPTGRRVVQKLSGLARGSRRAIAKVTVSAVRGVRWGGAFVYRMIIPPITPASLLFELILFVAFELFSNYLEEKEERNFKKQLERLPPLIEAAIKKTRARAADKLIRDFEGGGPGFVFARVEAEITKLVDASPFAVAQDKAEKWDIRLTRLSWVTSYEKPRVKRSEQMGHGDQPPTAPELAADPFGQALKSKTTTRLTFTIEEPIFTPFDYFLGALETLDRLLLNLREDILGIPGGIGPQSEKPKDFSEKDYDAARIWNQKLIGLLERHRSLEYDVGTDRARAIRKNMLWQGRTVMKRISKSLHVIIPLGKVEPDSALFEAIGLVHHLGDEFRRAQYTRHDGYYYRREEKVPDKLNGASYWRHIGWDWIY